MPKLIIDLKTKIIKDILFFNWYIKLLNSFSIK